MGPGGRRIFGTQFVRKTKASTFGGIKTTTRYRPGTRALREIRKYQASTKPVLPRAPFVRLVREVAQEVRPDFRFTKQCLVLLQEAAEGHVVEVIQDAYACARHARRVTLMPKDLLLAQRIRGERSRPWTGGPTAVDAALNRRIRGGERV